MFCMSGLAVLVLGIAQWHQHNSEVVTHGTLFTNKTVITVKVYHSYTKKRIFASKRVYSSDVEHNMLCNLMEFV